MKRMSVLGSMFLGIAVCVWTTIASQEADQINRVNMVFLALMLIITGWGYVRGIFRVWKITDGFRRAAPMMGRNSGDGTVVGSIGEKPKFRQAYLDGRYEEYKKSGGGELRQYINLYDMESYIRRGVFELVPDILTSLGILGTFIGLVLGLRGFDPSGYQEMSNSMSPLIEGIKVAFVTSIYGLAFAVPYSYGLRCTYGELEEEMEEFLERYDAQKEKDADVFQEILSHQRDQTEALKNLSEAIAGEMASRFDEVITPTFQRFGETLETMSENQRDMLQGAAAEFAGEFKKAFLEGFTEFEEGLGRVNEIQNQYMGFIQISMEKLENALEKNRKAMGEAELHYQKNMERMFQEAGQMYQREFRTFAAYLDKIRESQEAYVEFLTTSTRELASVYSRGQEAADSAMQEIYERHSDCLRELERAVQSVSDEERRQRQAMGEYLDMTREMGQKLVQNEQELEEAVRGIQAAMDDMAGAVRSAQDEGELVKLLRAGEETAASYRSELLRTIRTFSEEIRTSNTEDAQIVSSEANWGGEEQEQMMRMLLEELRELVEIEKMRQNRHFWNRWKSGRRRQ